MIQIFDTLSGSLKSLPTMTKKRPLRLFVCGPTVYDFSHIGHARTYILFDSFVKFLRSKNNHVYYIQNITDIDDKIINRARELKKTPALIARTFTKAHRADMNALAITSVNTYAPATQYIKEIVRQIEILIKKGFAYKIDGDGYYFEVRKFADYGKLAKRTEMASHDGVSRIDDSERKRDPRDFCLWKFKKVKDEPSWKTSLGEGRPGWHIEDTAISEKFFGPQYDIHGGGIDLIFPHHEAEITQQEAASGKKPFVKIWMHTGFLLVENEKMSKSLGNFITIRELLKRVPAHIFRFYVLLAHYRSPLNFTWDALDSATVSLSTIADALRRLHLVVQTKKKKSTTLLPISDIIKQFEMNFVAALEKDFNTPHALASIFTTLHRIQPSILSLSAKEASQVEASITNALASVGIILPHDTIPSSITTLIKKRELLRNNKQFIQSDALRKKIERLGYGIDDTPLGPLVWHKPLNSRPKI